MPLLLQSWHQTALGVACMCTHSKRCCKAGLTLPAPSLPSLMLCLLTSRPDKPRCREGPYHKLLGDSGLDDRRSLALSKDSSDHKPEWRPLGASQHRLRALSHLHIPAQAASLSAQGTLRRWSANAVSCAAAEAAGPCMLLHITSLGRACHAQQTVQLGWLQCDVQLPPQHHPNCPRLAR